MKILMQESIDQEWRGIIQHEINYFLAPLSSLKNDSHLEFFVESNDAGDDLFACKLNVKFSDGQSMQANSKSFDGRGALRNVLSRVRREIIRNNQFSHARHLVIP